MTSMVTNQTHVGCLVTTVVLGKNSKPFQREVERFLRNNGPEWLAFRMKAIWTAANHLRNGKPELARSVYQDAGIAYHKGDMTPKGPFRPVVRSYRDAMRPSVIRRYAAVLRFYTTLVLPKLSRKQSEKAYNSITHEREPVSILDKRGASIIAVESFARLWGRQVSDRVPKLKINQVKATSLSPNTYRYSRVKMNRRDRLTPLRPLAMSLLTEGYVPAGLEETDPFPLLRRGANQDGPMGRIGVIQEQGAKARVVAMPTARLQYAFLPLHQYLVQVDRTLMSSVLHDQERAIYGLLDHMGKGLPAFSTDLSSATDMFPRSVSLSMLRGMGLDTYADALEEVSSGDWESPWGTIHYGTGQPMGLYSSFPLFHLSNQAIANLAQVRAEAVKGSICKFNNRYSYFVLGDDIVFSDEQVEQEYRSIMTTLGVPISEQKSFQGNLVEFAGYIVTKSKGDNPMAFQPYKPPSGNRVTNPINFLAAMGAKASVISPLWKERVDMFSRTWSDRTPGLAPWVNQEVEPLTSSWDVAVLDNEFNLLSKKYPLPRRDLDPHIRYSDGLVKATPSDEGFTIIGLQRNKSTDLPRHFLETNRERLGQQPKHPRRVSSPYHSDPLIRKEREKKSRMEEQQRETVSPSPIKVRDIPDPPAAQPRAAAVGNSVTQKVPSKGGDQRSIMDPRHTRGREARPGVSQFLRESRYSRPSCQMATAESEGPNRSSDEDDLEFN